MASRKDAFDSLKEWSGSNSLLDFFLVIGGPPNEQGERTPMCTSFFGVRVTKVISDSVMLLRSDSSKTLRVEIPPDAEFWVSDASDPNLYSLPESPTEYGARLDWTVGNEKLAVLVERSK